MKILQINCVYCIGSTGKIVYDIHSELQKQGIESVVCYGRGLKVDEPNVYKTCSEPYSKFNNMLTRFTGLMYGGCRLSTQRLINVIKREKPDVVHLHCLNGYFVNIYQLINYLKSSGIKTVLTLHAEFMHTANCGHALDCDKWMTGCGNCPRLRKETKSILFDCTHKSWIKMKNAFDGFDENLIVASVSPWLMERAKLSPILADKHHCVVFNGVDTDVFHSYDAMELKKKHNITNEKVIFHATAGFNSDPKHIKGGYYVLELAKRLLKENINAKIIVAGNYDATIVPPKNLIFLGIVTDQKLMAQYYSMADVTLITSKKETFSMPVAESLCCGTPIVGFMAGAPEQIALPEYSGFVEYGDIDGLVTLVCKYLESSKKCSDVCENKSRDVFSKEVMCNEYCNLYTQW